MGTAPSVSAVVPTLAESGRIAALVDRLRAVGVDEVVVADGGSADGTCALARARGAVVVTAPRGRASQMNAGAAVARGEVLWFVHADGWPPPDAVDAIRAALADPGVVGGAFHTVTARDGDPGPPPRWLRLADLRQTYTRLPYGDQALFVRAATFAVVGGFRAELRLFEDVDLARRLWTQGSLRILRPPVVVSARRYEARPLRSLVAMNLFPTAFRLGVPTSALERWYGAPR
jgi:rSAM/selenodomain-associated transferase 2